MLDNATKAEFAAGVTVPGVVDNSTTQLSEGDGIGDECDDVVADDPAPLPDPSPDPADPADTTVGCEIVV